jgi:hypothetical protein
MTNPLKIAQIFLSDMMFWFRRFIIVQYSPCPTYTH